MSKRTRGVELAWQIAAAEAARKYFEYIEPGHLLVGLCKLEDFAAPPLLREMGVPDSDIPSIRAEVEALSALFAKFAFDPVATRREMRQHMGMGGFTLRDQPERTMHRSETSREVFRRADDLARERSAPQAAVHHLLAALLDYQKAGVAGWLSARNVDVGGLKEAALATQQPVPAGGIARAHPEAETSLLLRFGRDLTQLAREGKLGAAIGRKDEMLQVVRTLSRATKNNPVLIGEPGVGKTAIVEGLAWRMAQGNVPPVMRGKRIVQVNVADLVAGAKYRGEMEERLQGLAREAAAAPDVVLFIDEIHTVVGAGKGEGALDAANILKPALARGELRCIGATTLAEYRRYIEKDAALERRFQPITVNEATPEATIEILRGVRPRFEEQHGVTIGEDAVQAAVTLAAKHLPDRRLPDKAIDLLDEACARVQISRLSVPPDVSARTSGGIVTADTVAEVISAWTGIPLAQLAEDERARLLRMAEILRKRVIGQDQAIEAVARAVQRARAGLKPAGRPVAVLLFLGPTGVGKTELAKATAEFLFGSDNAMTRLDMSEFSERHVVARLIGSPPGYVGSEDEGQLTGALRRTPFCVVLLDEIEKAHPDVLNLFLQVFDDGRLTDAKGRTVDASNALFIMTSNIGLSPNRHRPLGFRPYEDETDRQTLLSEVKAALRPEFVNRIDSMIVFQPLRPEHIVSIARLMLRRLGEKLAEQGFDLQVTDAAVQLLGRLGYDEQYGARPLRRAIEQHVENPLSGMLLRAGPQKGDVVVVDEREGKIMIELRRMDAPTDTLL